MVRPLDKIRAFGVILGANIQEESVSLQQVLGNLVRADFLGFYILVSVLYIKGIVEAAPFVDSALEPEDFLVALFDRKPCSPF